MNSIAVWNTAFLGDAVLTLPLLQSLKAAWPEARLDFYVRGGLSGLFSAHPAINNVYEFKKQKEQRSVAAMRAMGAEVKKRGYDMWLSSHPSLRSAWIARKSGARVRVGYSSPWYNSLFYTNTVERHFPELHEIDRLLQLLKPLRIEAASTWPELALPQDLRDWSRNFFASLGQGPFLGLHPGSVWGTKRWPAKYFARIGRQALDSGAQALVFGGPGEEDTAAEVVAGIVDGAAEHATARVHNLAGKFNLPQLAACLAGLNCYVGNDSGPMHLAWCQRVPVVAIFGPTIPGFGFTPRGEGAVVMEPGADAPDCRPCSLHGPRECPKGHHSCMNDILPGRVWPEVEKRLYASA